MKYSPVLVCALLAGCLGNPAPRPDPARYDLGPLAPLAAPALSLGRVEVQAPAWLQTAAIQYREAGAVARRQAYAESLWVAPPAELIEAALRRQLIQGNGSGCRLKVELDELVQEFAASGDSRLRLEARVSLFSPRGDALLGRQAFALELAAGRDAHGSVAALIQLERQLAAGVGQWTGTADLAAQRAKCL